MKSLLIATCLLLSISIDARAEPVTHAEIDEANTYVRTHMETKYPIIKGRKFSVKLKDVVQDNKKFREGPAVAAATPGTIFLSEGFKYSDMADLVHEVVHQFQFAFALPSQCNNARERDAYNIQNDYATENNLPNRIVSQDFIDRVSSCQ